MTVILLAGPIAVGKSTVARGVAEQHDAIVLSARELLLALTDADEERRSLQQAGRYLDQRTKGRWLLEALEGRAPRTGGRLTIVDAVRTIRQTEPVLNHRDDALLVFLDAADEVRRLRYSSSAQQDRVKREAAFGASNAHPTEQGIRDLKSLAHLVIDTSGLTVGETCSEIGSLIPTP